MCIMLVFLCLSLLASSLIGCEETIRPLAAAILGPGDSLGDMAVVRCPYPIPHIQRLCTEVALRSGTCKIPAGLGHLWIANGAEEETAEELAGTWSDSDWSLVVDGQPVDLPAFGFLWYDDEQPASYYWDVALQHPTAGQHKVVWTHLVAGRIEEEVWKFTLADT